MDAGEHEDIVGWDPLGVGGIVRCSDWLRERRRIFRFRLLLAICAWPKNLWSQAQGSECPSLDLSFDFLGFNGQLLSLKR
jgi:hypothetical protein